MQQKHYFIKNCPRFLYSLERSKGWFSCLRSNSEDENDKIKAVDADVNEGKNLKKPRVPDAVSKDNVAVASSSVVNSLNNEVDKIEIDDGVDKQNESGWTQLHYAAFKGWFTMEN